MCSGFVLRHRSLWGLGKKGWRGGNLGDICGKGEKSLLVQEKARWGVMGSMDYLRRDDRECHLSADGLKQEKWKNCTNSLKEQEGEQSRKKELFTIPAKMKGYLPQSFSLPLWQGKPKPSVHRVLLIQSMLNRHSTAKSPFIFFSSSYLKCSSSKVECRGNEPEGSVPWSIWCD